ncbi:MAG: CDP-alcohol phosphatidyltransferase family protein [Acidimicrobiia bacterium]|nr:CDP-alcohol phosphatidyltransferase family protein [Acidimicrobiia bacterium]
MIDQRGRSWLTKHIVSPISKALVRLHISASVITVLGLAVTLIGAAILANGHPTTAGFVIGLGGAIDGVDGTVARLTGTASRRGAFMDTVADRVGEVAMFAGLAWFVSDEPLLALLSVIALGNSMLIPYVRSKAEAEGLDGKGGIMGRAERIILFCGLLIPVGWGWWGAEVMLWPMVVLTGLTVVQRYWKAWVALG